MNIKKVNKAELITALRKLISIVESSECIADATVSIESGLDMIPVDGVAYHRPTGWSDIEVNMRVFKGSIRNGKL